MCPVCKLALMPNCSFGEGLKLLEEGKTYFTRYLKCERWTLYFPLETACEKISCFWFAVASLRSFWTLMAVVAVRWNWKYSVCSLRQRRSVSEQWMLTVSLYTLSLLDTYTLVTLRLLTAVKTTAVKHIRSWAEVDGIIVPFTGVGMVSATVFYAKCICWRILSKFTPTWRPVLYLI